MATVDTLASLCVLLRLAAARQRAALGVICSKHDDCHVPLGIIEPREVLCGPVGSITRPFLVFRAERMLALELCTGGAKVRNLVAGAEQPLQYCWVRAFPHARRHAGCNGIADTRHELLTGPIAREAFARELRTPTFRGAVGVAVALPVGLARGRAPVFHSRSQGGEEPCSLRHPRRFIQDAGQLHDALFGRRTKPRTLKRHAEDARVG
eukprot:scaffold10331_cov71-Phaeocystis_antarctica.AAC.3